MYCKTAYKLSLNFQKRTFSPSAAGLFDSFSIWSSECTAEI